MILIIILLTMIITLTIQNMYFKDKKKYKNKCIKVYQDFKIPIIVTCLTVLTYDVINTKPKEINPEILMREQFFI